MPRGDEEVAAYRETVKTIEKRITQSVWFWIVVTLLTVVGGAATSQFAENGDNWIISALWACPGVAAGGGLCFLFAHWRAMNLGYEKTIKRAGRLVDRHQS